MTSLRANLSQILAPVNLVGGIWCSEDAVLKLEEEVGDVVPNN